MAGVRAQARDVQRYLRAARGGDVAWQQWRRLVVEAECIAWDLRAARFARRGWV